jgi:hypothetical protein
MFQLILPLHECADPATTESVAVESIAEPLHSVADSAAAESATKPFHSVADSATAVAALTKTS